MTSEAEARPCPHGVTVHGRLRNNTKQKFTQTSRKYVPSTSATAQGHGSQSNYDKVDIDMQVRSLPPLTSPGRRSLGRRRQS